MEGANGSTSCTLECVEDLNMCIDDVTFTIYAHVICKAPFRLLLGRPFHHLLLCQLKDHPNYVDVSICDPANPTQSIAVSSWAYWGAQLGFVSSLACQILSELPRMKSIDRYIASSSLQPLTNLLLAEHNADSIATVLAYKKVAKRVHLIAASLLEDF